MLDRRHQPRSVLIALLSGTALAYLGLGLLANGAAGAVQDPPGYSRTAH